MDQLKTASEKDFDRVFALLEDSFPPEEYRSREEQKALWRQPGYTVFLLPDGQNDDIKAFITVWKLEDFSFIEHFAVNPAYRGQGLGGQILRAVTDALPGRICLEVEPPDTETAERRIRFYERNGFFLNHYAYVQPPYAKEKPAVPLLIMSSGGKISQEQFQHIRHTLYQKVYRVLP